MYAPVHFNGRIFSAPWNDPDKALPLSPGLRLSDESGTHSILSHDSLF